MQRAGNASQPPPRLGDRRSCDAIRVDCDQGVERIRDVLLAHRVEHGQRGAGPCPACRRSRSRWSAGSAPCRAQRRRGRAPASATEVAAGQPGTPSCGPYTCNGTSQSYPTTCVTNADCAPGFICGSQKTCIAPVTGGGQCTSNLQCAGGTCTNHICCTFGGQPCDFNHPEFCCSQTCVSENGGISFSCTPCVVPSCVASGQPCTFNHPEFCCSQTCVLQQQGQSPVCV